MKKVYLSLAILFLTVFFADNLWAGKIIYPWRATTAIATPGETFEVWFIAEPEQTVNSVKLNGPYHSVNADYSVVKGNWVYDKNSENTYNQKLTVMVPPDAPADRYEIILKTSTGNVSSTGALKVVQEFQDEYYIIHTSDAHRWQHPYDGHNIHRKMSEIVKIGNVLDVQIFIETGDNMYSVKNHPWREEAYFHGFPELDIVGMHDSTAATFIVPGNHDSPRNAVELDEGGPDYTADFYNTYYGLQHYQFTYGDSRFVAVNDSWFYREKEKYESEYEYQRKESVQWLKDTPGTFSLVAGHTGRWFETIDDGYSYSMAICGHLHWDGMENPHAVNDELKRYFAISPRYPNSFYFNLYRVNNTTGEFTTPSGKTGVVEVLKSGNPGNPQTWELNYELSYAKSNNGSYTDNTATIRNDFDFPFEGASVRFVMEKGNQYEITQGTGYIEQQFDGDEFRIVDVKFDVPAGTSSTIGIGAT